MIIDFTDIPQSNKGGKYQDLFEQFACAFLETKGFEIVHRPDRGPDGKKDLIVKEIRKGISGKSELLWLVSCKHNAHSNRSVNDVDEPDISDRVRKFNCDGFIGFYSTIPSSALSNKLHSLKANNNRFDYIIYDNSRISNELLNMNQCAAIIANFFPNSFEKYRNLKIQNEILKKPDIFEAHLEVTKTALIILEIDKIEEEFENEALIKQIELLNGLFRYYKHRNEEIALSIFNFLYSVSLSLRASKSLKVSELVKSLVYTYFPSSLDYSSKKLIENGKNCIYFAYNITYESLIRTSNFEMAINGLLIWKYIYKLSREHNIIELTKEIEKYYQFLQQTVNRTDRKDLENARRLVDIFEKDLDRPAMDYPDIPADLNEIILKSQDINTI